MKARAEKGKKRITGDTETENEKHEHEFKEDS